ncbi:MAG TPA: YggS family pyridoxal phosphate-dependent enzyme [Candidatus Micrarchaeaceae archaeon]|nr:YggS family pyridoxal phosphate-dependent enzyme [Candidatus Micrarchaeaceae archaeon]
MLADVSQAVRQSGRPEGSVTLLPVTKGQLPEVAREAARLGLTTLGENYVQECAAKERLLQESGEAVVHWHLLGHLQRNKVKRAAQLFQLVESVDSLAVAQLLSRTRADQSRLKVLCEVELTGLTNRSGFAAGRLEQEFPRLLELEGIEVEGLMTVANPVQPERAFSACRELLDRLGEVSGRHLTTLSMGMSGDFQAAIAEGSTEVRIGSRLFGSRPSPPG